MTHSEKYSVSFQLWQRADLKFRFNFLIEMATIPIQNPQTPFLGRIPGGFRPSLMIRVKGKMTERRGRYV
jgi:hypothetical protein